VPETASPRIVLAIEDLLLASRVREALRGFQVDLVGWPTQDAAGSTLPPDCLLVSMAARRSDPVSAIVHAKELGMKVIAVAGHLETQRLDQARAAGADRVVANSSVSAHLPEILRAAGIDLSEAS